jgi:1-phosphofructokinase
MLHERGVAEVLLTLGGDGAVLSTADGGLWSARPPQITVRSTVGAGDCSLAGYLLADLAGAPPAERLRTAVAYGAASASLPGSAVPTPAQVDGPAVRVTAGMPGSAPISATPVPPISPNTDPAAGRAAR